jgi:uncharacterized protein
LSLRQKITHAFIVVLVVVSAASGLFALDSYQVALEPDVSVRMRDGIILRADVYHPKGGSKFPVLLERTPYNKGAMGEVGFGLEAAARGYVVVIQDTRGRYQSEGEWYPFVHESNDGYDTVEWAAALPWSDGRVGMFGGSYVGATQMLAAISHPPHLAGICPAVTASNYHEGWTYQGGAFEQWFNESWTSILAQDTLDRAVRDHTNALNGIWKLPLDRYPLFPLPAASSDKDLTRSLAPYFLDWLSHPSYDEYWKRIAVDGHYPDINVPSLTVAAWYDIFLGGSLRNYVGLKLHAGTEAARAGQHLLIALGGHAGSGRKVGDVDFGPSAAFDEQQVILSWYDHLFKNANNEFSKSKPVRMFVMGADEWRDVDDWPPPRARYTRYYLHSAGRANSSAGDGSLSTTAPASESSDRYVYDPAHPVPTIGGPLCCDSAHVEPGPRDQHTAEERSDVLVYTTPILAQDMEVTGPVSLDLYASSSAVDTDFTAKLVDVTQEGFARNLTEGIIRARYRNAPDRPELMRPGQVYKFTVDLWATGNVFRKGHRLRLEISSSNFPRFDRNLNTGAEPGSDQSPKPATNTVLHDAKHPSALILPIIPRQ